MSDPILDQPAYIEILMVVRQHFSLSRVAQYLGSKPQNISGWLAAKSVPTLKDFRERIVELGFFLKYIVQAPVNFGPTASQVLEVRAPLMPPWGVSFSSVHDASPIVISQMENPLERWAYRVVHNVRDLLPKGPHEQPGQPRPSQLTWEKLVLLTTLYQEERPKADKTAPAIPKTSPVLIWGESCAGRSTLANELLGAELFNVSPIPEAPRLRILSTEQKAVVEVPAFDGPAPNPQDAVQLLRYLFMHPDCRLLVVLSSLAFPTPLRLAFLAGLALIPCKLTVVISKLDLYASSEEQEAVSRYLRTRLPGFHVLTPPSLHMNEAMIGELRNATDLVGSTRLKLIAAAKAEQQEPIPGDLLEVVTAIICETVDVGGAVITGDTTFNELKLSEPQIGQLLLALESKLRISFSDRDTDLALRGRETVGWLVGLIMPLLGAISA